MERRPLNTNRSTPNGRVGKGATSVKVGQTVTFGTVFYPTGDDLDRKGEYPGDEAAQWWCLDQLAKDNRPARFEVLGFRRVESDVAGPRGPRTYVWLRCRRIS